MVNLEREKESKSNNNNMFIGLKYDWGENHIRILKYVKDNCNDT